MGLDGNNINWPCLRILRQDSSSQVSTSETEEILERNSQDADIPMDHQPMPHSSAVEDCRLKPIQKLRNSFEIIEFLGRGSFGAVIKVQHRIDQRMYALKVIPLDMNEPDRIFQEAVLLADVEHENVLRYHDSWIDDYHDMDEILHSENIDINFDPYSRFGIRDSSQQLTTSNGPKMYLCIQTELCETTLTKVIRNKLHKQPARAWKIFWQIVEGVSYLHLKNIFHGDLHSDNILLDQNDHVRIGDFGIASMLSGRTSTSHPSIHENDAKRGDIFSIYLIFKQIFDVASSVILGNKEENIQVVEPKADMDEITYLLGWLRDPDASPTCADLLLYKKEKEAKDGSFLRYIVHREGNDNIPHSM